MGARGTVEVLNNISGRIEDQLVLRGESTVPKYIQGEVDYDKKVINKPTLNAVTIEGHKLSEDYKLQGKMDVLTPQEIEKILYLD